MNSITIFWIIFACLLALIIFISVKYNLLKDESILPASDKPYSYAKTQMAWWTLIILSAFITIVLKGTHDIPVLHSSTIILLTISAGTLAAGRITDIADSNAARAAGTLTSRDLKTDGFLRDILSDKESVSIHRLQTALFNLVFGCWFIHKVILHLGDGTATNSIIPVIEERDLVLLGVSTATYISLKAGENKTKQ